MAVAERVGAEIVSADSMQVYRGMDIGTAKPSLLERRGVPHHLIDVAEPEEEFTVAQYRRLGRRVMAETRTPALLITGGSGLHFRALVDPMSFAPTDPALRTSLEDRERGDLVDELLRIDPEAGGHVDLANPRRVVRALEIYRLTGETPSRRAQAAQAEDVRRYRPEVPFTAVGIDPGASVDDRIAARVRRMQRMGLVEEVRRLAPRLGRTARSAVGYREILDAVETESDIAAALHRVVANTRKLAKRQRTWLQRDPRIRWIPWIEDIEARIERVMETLR